MITEKEYLTYADHYSLQIVTDFDTTIDLNNSEYEDFFEKGIAIGLRSENEFEESILQLTILNKFIILFIK